MRRHRDLSQTPSRLVRLLAAGCRSAFVPFPRRALPCALTTVAQVFAEWGIDFVKADFCHRPSGATATELYGNFSAALNATGRPILFSLCNWGEDDVEEWGAEFGQMFRIQMDQYASSLECRCRVVSPLTRVAASRSGTFHPRRRAWGLARAWWTLSTLLAL